MASYHIFLADKGDDLPGVEKIDGVAVLKWPVEEGRKQQYGMERRNRTTGSELVIPWHRIAFVRVGN